MSDREMYCDRDPYDRDSADILFSYSIPPTKKDIEMEYYEYYRKLYSKCLHSQFLIRIYEGKPEHYQQELNRELFNVEICEELLSKLELTTPIENILQRERKPDEVITLRYLNRKLPNIPYNVLSSRSNFYLSNEEISIIKNIIDDDKNNKPSEKQEEKKIQPTTQIKPAPKKIMEDKKYYTSCGIIGFILALLYLIGIGDLDYVYYQFLRITSLILIPIFMFIYGWFIKETEMFLDLVNFPTLVTLVLFNPILPIYLDKDTWVVLDFICAMIFFAIDVYIFVLYRNAKKDFEKESIIIDIDKEE